MTQGVAKGHRYRVLSFRWIRHPTAISYCRIYYECFENKLWLFSCRTCVPTSTRMALRLKIYLHYLHVGDVNASSWDFDHRLFEERHFEGNLSSCTRLEVCGPHVTYMVSIWFPYSGSKWSYTPRTTGMSSMLMQKRIQKFLNKRKVKNIERCVCIYI